MNLQRKKYRLEKERLVIDFPVCTHPKNNSSRPQVRGLSFSGFVQRRVGEKEEEEKGVYILAKWLRLLGTISHADRGEPFNVPECCGPYAIEIQYQTLLARTITAQHGLS